MTGIALSASQVFLEGVGDAQVLCLPPKIAVWNSSPDPADSPESSPSNPPQDLPSTRAGGQDDVSSKQTPSNYKSWVRFVFSVFVGFWGSA